MITLLRRLGSYVTSQESAERMLRHFQERFPGRCPICSYHHYGVMHGMTSEPTPPKHDCLESKTE